ncbi:MAG: N-acetylmuramoyl-L-alanine amidase, partial [Gammaproteobacteria bacterium]
MLRYRPLIFALLLTGSIQAWGAASEVRQVRIAHTPERTRVVLDLNQAAQPKVFTLSNPSRLVVDIPAGYLTRAARQFPSGVGVVSRIRGANRSDGMARLVFDLNGAAQPHIFALRPDQNHGHRLVLDLAPGGSAPVAPRQAPVTASKPKVTRKPPSAAGAGRDIVIAVDAGHGGKDPGARGHGGLREKDAVLQISRRLARMIDAEPGMRAMMTRNDDSFIVLRDRMERARARQSDLFISVHADAFSDRRVRGATVYALSNKGATDEAARRLAARENASDLVGGVTLADKDEVVASVLMDLSQNATLSSSIEVGDEIIGELRRVGKVRKNRVQQAPFLVLKSPDIPSILVETAFISNPQDESNLGSVQY